MTQKLVFYIYRINETYGAYGRGRGDYHFVKTGKHAKYNYPSVTTTTTNTAISFTTPAYICSLVCLTVTAL